MEYIRFEASEEGHGDNDEGFSSLRQNENISDLEGDQYEDNINGFIVGDECEVEDNDDGNNDGGITSHRQINMTERRKEILCLQERHAQNKTRKKKKNEKDKEKRRKKKSHQSTIEDTFIKKRKNESATPSSTLEKQATQATAVREDQQLVNETDKDKNLFVNQCTAELKNLIFDDDVFITDHDCWRFSDDNKSDDDDNGGDESDNGETQSDGEDLIDLISSQISVSPEVK